MRGTLQVKVSTITVNKKRLEYTNLSELYRLQQQQGNVMSRRQQEQQLQTQMMTRVMTNADGNDRDVPQYYVNSRKRKTQADSRKQMVEIMQGRTAMFERLTDAVAPRRGVLRFHKNKVLSTYGGG